MVTAVLSLRISIYFVHQVIQYNPCFRRSILLCATILKVVNKKKLPRVRERKCDLTVMPVVPSPSRFQGGSLILSFSLSHLLPSTMVTGFSFYEKPSNMVTRDRGRKDEVDILSRLLCILQSFKAIL